MFKKSAYPELPQSALSCEAHGCAARGRKHRASDSDWEGIESLPVFRPRCGVPGIRRVNPSCVDELAPFKRGKCLDGFSYLLLGEPQVVDIL